MSGSTLPTMSQPAAFEVPAGRRELSAAERFAGNGHAGKAEPEPAHDDPPAEDQRLVPLKAVMDIAGFVFILAGFSVGVLAAWIAGGRVPGLATLAGALLALGFLLNG